MTHLKSIVPKYLVQCIRMCNFKICDFQAIILDIRALKDCQPIFLVILLNFFSFLSMVNPLPKFLNLGVQKGGFFHFFTIGDLNPDIKAGGRRIFLSGYSVLACFHLGMFNTLNWSLWANLHRTNFVYLIIEKNIAYSTSFLILKLITYICNCTNLLMHCNTISSKSHQLFPEKTSSGTSIIPSLISLGWFNFER